MFFQSIYGSKSNHFILKLPSDVSSFLNHIKCCLFAQRSANVNANQSSSGQPRDKCQTQPRNVKKKIKKYQCVVPAKNCHNSLTFSGWDAVFLCLMDLCLTGCKPANRIGPHGLILKGQKLFKASTQSELS